MRAWMVRAGRQGKHEDLALEQSRVVIGWQELGDLSAIREREDLRAEVARAYPEAPPGRVQNYEAQLWAFLRRIEHDDLVVLPLKRTPALAIGRVTGDYEYVRGHPPDARHTRRVEWLNPEVPRSVVAEDILLSLGYMTVCEIKRNEAPRRLRTLALQGQDPDIAAPDGTGLVTPEDAPPPPDIEASARDQIRQYVAERFPGHALARLVAAILEARGLVVDTSPPGPDGGIDVLAGAGVLGMDAPRVCVQVKSGITPVDVKVVRELQGVMARYQADQGLLVAWAGLNRPATTEIRNERFRLRVWNADRVLDEIFDIYDRLPADLQAELPLKRVWTVVLPDTE